MQELKYYNNIFVLNLHEFDDEKQEIIVKICNEFLHTIWRETKNEVDFIKYVVGSVVNLGGRIKEDGTFPNKFATMFVFISFSTLCAILVKENE